MRDRITGDDIFAQILILRGASDPRVFVVVEGPSDCQALDPHIDQDSAQTIPAHAKNAVERAVELSDRHANSGPVIGIADRDWVGLLEKGSGSPSQFYTDDYDLDASIVLLEDVLQRVVSAISDRESIQGHERDAEKPMYELVLATAGVVGMARFVSARERWEVRLGGFPVHAALTESMTEVDIDELATIAIARSTHAKVEAEDLARVIRSSVNDDVNWRQYCSGHDVKAVLAAFAKGRWACSISAEAVGRMIRSAFSCANLKSTRLYTDVEAWAQASGVRVWACADELA